MLALSEVILFMGEKNNNFNQTYTKGPESKHNDDEVNCVSEEHQHIDVCDCTVLRMDQVIEELPHRKVDLQEPTKKF